MCADEGRLIDLVTEETWRATEVMETSLKLVQCSTLNPDSVEEKGKEKTEGRGWRWGRREEKWKEHSVCIPIFFHEGKWIV